MNVPAPCPPAVTSAAATTAAVAADAAHASLDRLRGYLRRAKAASSAATAAASKSSAGMEASASAEAASEAAAGAAAAAQTSLEGVVTRRTADPRISASIFFIIFFTRARRASVLRSQQARKWASMKVETAGIHAHFQARPLADLLSPAD